MNSIFNVTLFLLMVLSFSGNAQTYPPEAGAEGSTAIHKDSPLYIAWATGITVERGFVNSTNPNLTANGSNKASYGQPSDALGYPDGDVVSLGDGGYAILTFQTPIYDGEGHDFAVFENGGVSFLELAVVEVSSNGQDFFRFPAHSQTQTTIQIGSFGTPSATYLNNIAGKYSGQYGTPFDIGDLQENPLLDKNHITHVKVIDVIGSIDPQYATLDSFGNAINDSHPTPFNSCGFDLQAVGVINPSMLSRDNFAKNNIEIYPNPAREYITIKLDDPATVSILDTSGRNILEKNIQGLQQIDVSNLTSGIYIIEVISVQGNRNAQHLIIR